MYSVKNYRLLILLFFKIISIESTAVGKYKNIMQFIILVTQHTTIISIGNTVAAGTKCEKEVIGKPSNIKIP